MKPTHDIFYNKKDVEDGAEGTVTVGAAWKRDGEERYGVKLEKEVPLGVFLSMHPRTEKGEEPADATEN